MRVVSSRQMRPDEERHSPNYGPGGGLRGVHLFIAGPVGLAFLLGQLLNTFGTIRTYEHVSDHSVGHYSPAVALKPSG
jgi:SMODS-associated and fused to various effectors sensor domain